ncbi:MAG: DUF86 domain-containing protein [Candidatus Edwardsbacteria bacterium]
MRINDTERERLLKILNFLEEELLDLETFFNIDYPIFERDKQKRKSLERTVENIVNAGLDIAKIILIMKNIGIPDTYREYFLKLLAADFLNHKLSSDLAKWVKLRNILAHEYLDIRWQNMRNFLSEGWKSFKKLAEQTRKFLQSGKRWTK